jgi:hypothetical protein
MIARSVAERPTDFEIFVGEPEIVDVSEAVHQPGAIQFQILVATVAIPLAAVLMPLTRLAYRAAASFERPTFLDRAIFQVAMPVTRKEGPISNRPWMNSPRFRHALSSV